MRNFLFILFCLLISCSAQKDLSIVKRYLNASDVAEKDSYMAENYRSWFMEKKGEGEDKNSALASFSQWDGPLHPDVYIFQHQRKGNTWTLDVLEENDFSKMIDFPGWKATVQLTVDNHKITEMIYIPDSLNPNYKKWLNPAVQWLHQNYPHELQAVYKNDRLVKTDSSAIEWIRLLRLWRESSVK